MTGVNNTNSKCIHSRPPTSVCVHVCMCVLCVCRGVSMQFDIRVKNVVSHISCGYNNVCSLYVMKVWQA